MGSKDKVGEVLNVPSLPACPRTSIDGMALAAVRDRMTELAPDVAIERAVQSIVERGCIEPSSVEPIQAVQAIIDSIRTLPRGDERLCQMNTLVRTLGRPHALANFLDMISDAAARTGGREHELSLISQRATQHSVYGWCGQTLLVLSGAEPTIGTLGAEDGVRELMGEVPPAVWGLSMHIWQPNPRARGFMSGKRFEPGIIIEPPHSHPFDFASMVTVGEMHQSIYVQRDQESQPNRPARAGRYDGTELAHVFGVWPPHDERSSSGVLTVEERVPLSAGDSYYLTCDTIHDVEISAATAWETPAITLFLGSEAIVKPHVYMAPSMADYHDDHPDLKRRGRALSLDDWRAKLVLVAAYLRGEQPTLDLRNLIDTYAGEYAFFHA